MNETSLKFNKKMIAKNCFFVALFLNCVIVESRQVTSDEPSNCTSLNKFIDCYVLTEMTHISQNRWSVELWVSAFSSDFILTLFRQGDVSSTVLSSNLKIKVVHDNNSVLYKHGTDNYFHGHVRNHEKSSSVHGHFDGAVFNGIVHMESEVYNFEPASKYLTHNVSSTTMLVYRDRDVHFLNNSYGVDSLNEAKDPHNYRKAFEPKWDELYMHTYSSRYNTSQNRRARALPENLRTCELFLVADHTYYNYIAITEGLPGDSEAEIVSRVLASMQFAVEESDRVFSATQFFGDASDGHVRFMIKEVDLYATANAQNYLLRPDGSSVEDLLDSFADYNFDNYCLALLFVRREFINGVIGLAYKASSSLRGTPGGVCQPRFRSKSYNSLLVTTLNFGRNLPARLVAVTAIHEFGHAFGASHDRPDDLRCSPSDDEGGLYVMTAVASSTFGVNNEQFSPCSIAEIAPVIDNKAVLCFVENEANICGNQVVEEGEECDCGFNVNCQGDMCCQGGCRLRNTAICSPQASRCCTDACQIQTASISCRSAMDCSYETFCTGISHECPEREAKPNGTMCMGGQRMCAGGECVQSVCDFYGYAECFCSDASLACTYCCQNVTTSECLPAYGLGIFNINNNNTRITLLPGQRCDEGVCNQEMECVYSGADDILDKLDDIIDDSPVNKFIHFVKNYWVLLLAGLGGLFVLVIMSITLYHACTVQRPKMGHYSHKYVGKLIARAKKTRVELQNKINQTLEALHRRPRELKKLKKLRREVAVTRLAVFFPETSVRQLVEAVRRSKNEKKAVKHLLRQNQPMLKRPT